MQLSKSACDGFFPGHFSEQAPRSEKVTAIATYRAVCRQGGQKGTNAKPGAEFKGLEFAKLIGEVPGAELKGIELQN